MYYPTFTLKDRNKSVLTKGISIFEFFNNNMAKTNTRLSNLKTELQKLSSFELEEITKDYVIYKLINVNKSANSCDEIIYIFVYKKNTTTAVDKIQAIINGDSIPNTKYKTDPTKPEENKNKITFVFSSDSHKLKDGVENDITITLNNLILPKTKDEIITELAKLQYKFDGNNPENIFNNNFKKESVKFVNESKEEIKEDNISVGCKLEIGNNCFNEKALEENKEPEPKKPEPKEKGKEETPNDFETPNNETPTEGKQENKKPSKCKCSGK